MAIQLMFSTQSVIKALLLLAIFSIRDSYAAPSPETAYDVAKRKWDKKNFSNYSFTSQRLCFCFGDILEEISVAVENGSVKSVVYTTPPKGGPNSPSDLTWVETIEDVFARIKEAIDNNYYDIVVDYDNQNGFPTDVFIDEDSTIADEEYFISISNLAPVV